MGFKGSMEDAAKNKKAPLDIRETYRTLLHAMHVAEQNQRPSTSAPVDSTVRWSLSGEREGLVKAEQETYDKPLTERNLADAYRYGRTTLNKVVTIPSSDGEKHQEIVGSMLYDFRRKCIILWSIALLEKQRGLGLAEQLLASTMKHLNENRTKLVDFIDDTHESAAQEHERSTGDACELLLRLGFENVRNNDIPHAYHHKESDCTIILAKAPASSKLRSADALSMKVHLDNRGILSEEYFERFLKEGWLPKD